MTNENLDKYTPMMRQYLSEKKHYPDAILFFRLGDFYEMFFEDALIASKELEIALTKRGAGLEEKAPMCGIPYHVANQYISRLIKKGYKVAICDQVEDPKLAKGIVKRQVTKVHSPGTFSDVDYLDHEKNNYLASIFTRQNYVNIAFVDFSTGELFVMEKTILNRKEVLPFLRDQLEKISPAEVLLPSSLKEDTSLMSYINIKSGTFINFIDIEGAALKDAVNLIDNHQLSQSLLSNIKSITELKEIQDFTTLNILLEYLQKTQKYKLSHINSIKKYLPENHLYLDENSKRNLELVKGYNTGKKKGSLLEVLDKTKTSMGSRMLRRWLEEPLNSKSQINARLNVVEDFLRDLIFLDDIWTHLNNIYDIERLSVKISNDSINPKEAISLRDSLLQIKEIQRLMRCCGYQSIVKIADKIDTLDLIENSITNIIVDNPSINITEDRIIKPGFDKELDRLFLLKNEGQKWILDLEEREKERTGIKNLRIKYNKILGYFIEITKSNMHLVPDEYIRKQTLVGSERYFSLELKEMESEIINSKDKALEMQCMLFSQLREFIKENVGEIQNTAKSIANIDCLVSLAVIARNNNYCKPTINEDDVIEITQGRHPIVEYNIKDESFVPNDTLLDLDRNLIHLITGPNMAGKSTYMRQVALIAIMAHLGSFVPATEANISILDRIFTRIGASDNLAQGESTFMVEMKEVANIISFATKRSLLILDEVGRGTSTYDGLSIAWALLEYLLTTIKAKTLFATHYHELTDLSKHFKSLSNLTIEIEEEGSDIIFLRKIIPGYTNNSYGIEVATLAGINGAITSRAREILKGITNKSISKIERSKLGAQKKINEQTFFQLKEREFINNLTSINVNEMTPLEAINMLHAIIKEANVFGDDKNE